MILLIGASGYIGSAFAWELERRQEPFFKWPASKVSPVKFTTLSQWLEDNHPSLVINAAGYTGHPNVDACKEHPTDTYQGNVTLPLTIAQACWSRGFPWAHVSSGCIYSGAKLLKNGKLEVHRDLRSEIMEWSLQHSPSQVIGFSEEDRPNFTFQSPPCSHYSGTKALAEEALSEIPNGYIWRLRIPFDHFHHPRNYLSKLQTYPKVYYNHNSLSHRGDFVKACLDLWQLRAPFGVYNLTNPGYVNTREVVELMRKQLKLKREFEYWNNDLEFYTDCPREPRSNCILDTEKAERSGVAMRPVREALLDSLKHWKIKPPRMTP